MLCMSLHLYSIGYQHTMYAHKPCDHGVMLYRVIPLLDFDVPALMSFGVPCGAQWQRFGRGVPVPFNASKGTIQYFPGFFSETLIPLDRHVTPSNDASISCGSLEKPSAYNSQGNNCGVPHRR